MLKQTVFFHCLQHCKPCRFNARLHVHMKINGTQSLVKPQHNNFTLLSFSTDKIISENDMKQRHFDTKNKQN